VRPDVCEHLRLCALDRDVRRLDQRQQTRLGVHAPHEVVHAREGVGRLVHHEVDSVVDRRQVRIGHDARDLDDDVLFNVETCHFEIEPDQTVVIPTVRHARHAIADGTGRFPRRWPDPRLPGAPTPT
jgi:hypothetical protein